MPDKASLSGMKFTGQRRRFRRFFLAYPPSYDRLVTWIRTALPRAGLLDVRAGVRVGG